MINITDSTSSDELTIKSLSSTDNEHVVGSEETKVWYLSFIEYFLFFLIILEFNTAYLEYPQLWKYSFYGTILLTLLLLFIRKSSFKIEGILVLYYLGSLLPLLNVYPGWGKHFIKLYWIMTPLFMAYFLSLRRIGFNSLISFLLKYSNIVTVLALISLVYWVLGSTLNIIQPTMSVPNSWKGDGVDFIPTFHFLYFETQETTFMGYETVRNSGIFNEGPMYNMILCVALSMELFLRPYKSFWRIILLAVTIVTTFTTTGFLFLCFAGAWVVFKFFSQKARILLIVLLPLLVIGTMNFSDAVLEDKESSTGEGSLRSRAIDILTCIDVGMENPILGQGLFTKKTAENQGGSYGFSNSLFTLFADGGLYTVFLYIAALVLIPYRYFRYSRQLWPLMMFSFFGVFVITISHFQFLSLLFVAFGCAMFDRELE